jgi:hypothetical protein
MLQTISQISAKERTRKDVVKAVKSHVLLVENDSQLAQLIAQGLSCEGYQISLTEDGISELLPARQLISGMNWTSDR